MRSILSLARTALALFPVIAILSLLNAGEGWWFTFVFLGVFTFLGARYQARQEAAQMEAIMGAIQSGRAEVTKIEVPSDRKEDAQ